jgi:hypothetical protein
VRAGQQIGGGRNFQRKTREMGGVQNRRVRNSVEKNLIKL